MTFTLSSSSTAWAILLSAMSRAHYYRFFHVYFLKLLLEQLFSDAVTGSGSHISGVLPAASEFTSDWMPNTMQ